MYYLKNTLCFRCPNKFHANKFRFFKNMPNTNCKDPKYASVEFLAGICLHVAIITKILCAQFKTIYRIF